MYEINEDVIQHFREKVDRSGGEDACWEWMAGKYEDGYGQFRIGFRKVRAHRIAYQLVCGQIPGGLHVLHRCDNPACCNPSHLFLGTNQENMDDRNSKGRSARGEKNGRCKLSAAQVAEIRRRYSYGTETLIVLAKVYGISYPQIRRIVHDKAWKEPA